MSANREQFANTASDTLNGGIDSDDTAIVVNDGSEFPVAGNFRLKIGDELLLCTARSTNTLTVVRGIEGSAAASHSDTAPVTHILTAGSIDRMGKDNNPLWGSTAPPLGKIVDDAGEVIAASGFSWTGQGGAIVTDQSGTIVMRVDAAAGDNFRIQRRPAPATPYSYVAAFQACGYRSGIGGSVPNFGIGLRDSSNGKMVAILVLCDGTGGQRLQVSNLTNETTFGSSVSDRDNYTLISPVLWLKAEDDGTNTVFYISADGIEWIQVVTQGRTAFTTDLDEVFWFGNNVGAGADFLVRLCHWSRES